MAAATDTGGATVIAIAIGIEVGAANNGSNSGAEVIFRAAFS
jgi:hypothetical protein